MMRVGVWAGWLLQRTRELVTPKRVPPWRDQPAHAPTFIQHGSKTLLGGGGICVDDLSFAQEQILRYHMDLPPYWGPWDWIEV